MTLRRLAPVNALWLCLLNWLVPGLGYIIAGDRKRGVVLMALLYGCFAVGVAMGGFILMPVWMPGTRDFNPVAILTYLTQAFHGSGWLGLQVLHHLSESSPEAHFNLQRMAAGYAYSDVGSFHLIVAGGLNYLSTVRLYDLLTGNPELSAPDYKVEDGGGAA